MRVDRFNDVTGVFTGPQLDEEGGVSGLSGAGESGGGLAVGHAFSGEQVYVQANGGVVGAYSGESGKLLGVWSGAHTAAGGFHGEVGLAVDQSKSLADEDKGDVYVAAHNPKVVDVFAPSKATKAGEEPAKVVTELQGTCNVPGEALPCAPGSLIPFNAPLRVAVSPATGDVFVADGEPEQCAVGAQTCVVDVFEPEPLVAGSYKFLSTITEAEGTPFRQITGLAVDGSGDVYVAQGNSSQNVTPDVVDQFAASGELVGRLTGAGPAVFSAVTGVAVDPGSGHVFVADWDGVPRVAAFGEGFTIPDVRVVGAGKVKETTATLEGAVKLDGVGSADCGFEYGTSHEYSSGVRCEPPVVSETEGPEPEVKKTITGLLPDTTYFFRTSATIEHDGVRHMNTGLGSEDEGSFTTSGPGLDGESASEVVSTAASLDAAIDPNGAQTSYYFQLSSASTQGCTPGLCRMLPGAPVAIGSTTGEQAVSQRAQGLTPGTTYHYRVVVLSEPEAGVVEEFPEADQTFTTEPAGSKLSLPDGRQWEQVTPTDKHGATVQPIGEAGVVQAAASGDAITYLASKPTEGAPGYFQEEQILSTHSSTGWSSQDISLPHASPVEHSTGGGQEYRFFSEDLSRGLAEPFGDFTSLKPFVFPPDTERTPYVRHDATCASEPGSCYEPLVTGAPGYADVPEGTVFNGSVVADLGAVSFVGGSSDLSRVVVYSRVGLVAGFGPGLYEWVGEAPAARRLVPVSVGPCSPAPCQGASFGGEVEVGGPGIQALDTGWAVSGDGSRVVFTVGGVTDGRVYMRDVNRGQTFEVGGVGAEFQDANREGTRVYYTEKGGLFICEVVEVHGELRCHVCRVAPGGVEGAMLGASENGVYAYFVADANQVFMEYDAAGACELPVLITQLSSDDAPDWTLELANHTSGVSPDGRWLAFMSDRALTGYDNLDVVSGKPDEEVFLYGAGSGRLVCVSCNPSGARPHGFEVGFTHRLATGSKVWSATVWVSGNIPGWTPFTLLRSRYQSRYLSDSGRLFFNSSDALVSQDVNGAEDVYEFEPAGIGSCVTVGVSYSAVTGGCVGLISSGTASGESAFLDASVGGDDVFFMTAEKLVAQDIDNAYDVYDAHVCSAAVPCVQSPAGSSVCETADACRVVPAPQPQIFGSGPSETFSGPGNASVPTPLPGHPVESRAERLAKALKACHKDRSKKKRGVCEAAAKRKYDAMKGARKSSSRAHARKSALGRGDGR